jgi:hypothetical protein
MQIFDLCAGTGHSIAGSISFDEAPSKLAVERTALGFKMLLPTKIHLRWADERLPRPVLTGMTCVVSACDSARKEVELGLAVDTEWYFPAKGGQEFSGNLYWRGDFETLAWFEKQRNGKQPVLTMRVDTKVGKAIQGTGPDGYPYEVCTVPKPMSGTMSVKYPTDIWNEMVRTLGVSETIVLQIPLPGSRPAPWDLVWTYLSEARECLEKGGTTGWKGCVVAVREALKTWQTIEKEDMGQGWTVPNQHQLWGRTKKQRLDCIRWNLLQAAHLGPHTPAEDWSRDDAILMLSGFAALLAERGP